MIIGDPQRFAIEANLNTIYPRRIEMATGYFLYHVNGQSFGIRELDTTIVGYAFDECEKRFLGRGTHGTSFASHSNPAEIRKAVWVADLGIGGNPDTPGAKFLGLSTDQFLKELYNSKCQAHLYCDEAFDDGSFVLIFDIGDKVRIAAQECLAGLPTGDFASRPFQDVWLSADEFYGILNEWLEKIENEWRTRLSNQGLMEIIDTD